MDIIELVKEQIVESHKKVIGLAKGVPFEDWYTIPKGIDTNIAWQIGHLIISKYFQLVVAPIGSTREVYEVIPFKEHLSRYGIGTQPTTKLEDSPDPEVLLGDYNKIQEFVLSKLDDFDINTLQEPTTVPHPIAKNRYESLMWSFQHEIWHCGHLSMIRRGLGKPLKFGG